MVIKARYFRVSTEGAFCGEKNDYYAAVVMSADEDPAMNVDFCRLVDECMFENASDWHNEDEHEMSFDEYLEESDFTWEEIDYKEYAANTPEFMIKHEQEDF